MAHDGQELGLGEIGEIGLNGCLGKVAVGLGDLLGHPVKCVSEFPEIPGPADFDPRAVIAVRHPTRRSHD